MISYAQNFVEFFKAGGPLMIPLAMLSAYIYFVGFGMLFKLGENLKICADKRAFRENFDALINSQTARESESENIKYAFAAVRMAMLSGVERRLKMLRTLSAVAPLIGLLGTVSGMMICIGAAGLNGSESLVAEGISKALITTQTGLCIVIPALVLAMAIQSKIQKILIALCKLENAMISKEVQHGS